MLRLRLFLLIMACLVVLVGPAHADATTTVFPESGRYSLEIPIEWVSSHEIGAAYQPFIGENINVAQDEAVLESLLDGKAIGDGLTITLIPVAQQVMYGENPVALDDLSLRSRLDMGLYGASDVETFMIGEYNAAKGRTATALPPFSDLPSTGVTAVLVDDFVYTIAYGSTNEEGLEALENIAATFKVNAIDTPPLDPNTLTQRPALNIDDALSLPLAPNWLVMHSTFPTSTITSLEGYIGYGYGESSSPKQYTIIPENQSAFLLDYYEGMRAGRTPLDAVKGLVVEITAYPYDSKLGYGDVAATSDQRQTVLKRITQGLSAYNTADIASRLINGVPVLSVDLNSSALGADSVRFHLVMVDVNYKFYVIAFAAPADLWIDQYATVVEALDAGITVNSFSSLASGVPIGIQNGQQAPDFSGTLVGGAAFNLADYRGKVVLLNFWASWCQPCVEEMPALVKLAEDHPDLVILAVNFAEDEATVDDFVATYELPFTVAYDVAGEINQRYEIYGYPTNIVIDHQGIIYGRADPTSLDFMVENALGHVDD